MLPGLILSAIIVAFVIYRLDFERLVLSLRSIRMPLLGAGVMILLLTLLIRSWRWYYLLKPIKPIGAMSLVSATSIGAMADMILPARAGDLIRAYLLGEREHISKISTLSTIIVEKIFDIAVILLAAIALVTFLGLTRNMTVLPSRFNTGLLTIALALAMLGLVFWILLTKPQIGSRVVNALRSWLPANVGEKIADGVQSFIDGLQTVRIGSNLLPISLLSLLLWSTFAFSNFLILRSFELQLPIYASVMILIFQILGVTLPSSPGFIGTYHAAVIVGLAAFGISQELALGVAITMHAAFFGPFILVGILFVWRENFSLQNMWTFNMEKQDVGGQ